MERMDATESLLLASAFVARSPVYMTLLDLEGRHIAVSPSFIDSFLKPAGITAERFLERHTGEFRGGFTGIMEEVVAQLDADGLFKHEEDFPAPTGGIRSLRVLGRWWRDDDGQPVAILITYQDITAERAAEAARRQYEAELKAVVDNLPAQICLMDLDSGRVTLLNEQAINASATVLGTQVGGAYREQLSSERLAAFDARVAEAEAAGGYLESEFPLPIGPNAGRTARVKHIIFHDGGVRKLLWMAEDVTELREATLALERAVAEAEAANRAKSEFLANMSHEIRTPLNGVMGVAGALARTALSGPQTEMVSLIETSAKSLETLLSDILDLARIEAGKMEIRPEPFDLAASVNACGALFEAAAQAKGLMLEVRIAPEARGGYVGDPVRIRQILSNLIGNAVKFTQGGSVTLAVERVGADVVFAVRDTGIGFDAETKARLFSRFEQADGSITRRFGGTGLGLAISHSLAEAMGGRLEADGEPGVGAIFTFTAPLPRCEASTDDADAAAAPEPDAALLGGLRVLLAEDHPTNRRVVELILGAAGVDLDCVEDGAQALEAFRAGGYDLVLMDMQMPVMDGLTAVREIRKLEAQEGRPRTPITVLTANAMPEHVGASLAAGADGHLSKPIQAGALLQRVGEMAQMGAGGSEARSAAG
jgi:signal transduction histidine kinase/ActR/RegA family two-component response regulator